MAPAKPDQTTETVPGRLEIAIQELGSTTTIAVAGEWDVAERQATRQAIANALRRSPENVVLDLSELTFIDSSGIHVIVELHKRSVQHDVRLVIVPGSPAVQRPFDYLELTRELPFLTAVRDSVTSDAPPPV